MYHPNSLLVNRKDGGSLGETSMTAPASESRSNAYVIYEFERRAYEITEKPVRIGRDASNDIVLREPAISRFHSEVRRDNDQFVLHSTGSGPATVNDLPAVEPQLLTEGAHVKIGSAILTFTQQRLPIGVSVIERATPRAVRDDIGNRRDTIKNPILRMPISDQPPGPYTRAKILFLLAGVTGLLYVLGLTR